MAQKKTSKKAQETCDLTIGEVAIDRLINHLKNGDLEAIRIALSTPEILSLNLLEFSRNSRKHFMEFAAIVAKSNTKASSL